MKRLRRVPIALLLAVVLLGSFACAPGDDEGMVEIAAVWTGAEQENFRAVLDAFERDVGIRVTFTPTGDDIATVLRTRIEGGDPPALAILPQPGLMADLAGQNALEPIEGFVGAAIDERYAPIWRELGSVDGTLYGLFFKAANKSTVWYSTEAFQTAGVEPPETWEELRTTLATLRDAGIDPLSIGGADGWVLTDWFENIYIRTAGPERYDQLARHEIPWTDESVKEALRIFAEILEPDLIHRGDATALEFVPSVDAVFATPPSAAIVYEGDFVPGVTTVDDAVAGETYDVFDFPSIAGSERMVVGGGDVVVMLDDTPEARELLEFLATAEAAEIWAHEGGFSSPNGDVDPDVYPDEIRRRTAQAIIEATVFRFDLSDLAPSEFGGTPGRGMWLILQRFARDPADVDGTAQRLEEAAAAAYRE